MLESNEIMLKIDGLFGLLGGLMKSLRVRSSK